MLLAESLRRNDVRAMPFNHQVAVEPQDFAHEAVVLIAVDNDHGVDALIDGLDGESEISDSLQCPSPVPAQRRLPTDNARRLRKKLRGDRGGKHDIVVEMSDDGLDIVSIPRLDPLTVFECPVRSDDR